MIFLRTLLAVVLAAVVLVAGPAAPALAAPDYRGVIDIAFPAVASSRYSNDFANDRSGGRVHRATDLFGPMGSRIFAARGGTVIWAPREQTGLAGYALQILGDDGRVYAYYHLGPDGARRRKAVVKGINQGTRVSRGQHIGYLGDSGNAAGGAPHLHFEIHDTRVTDPYGSNRVNPYASLRAAQGLSADMSGSPAPVVSGTSGLRLGARGPAVVKWQRRLNRTRINNLVVDGVFGPGTHAATVSFQKSVGLGPAGLGVVGPRTRAAMTRRLAEGPAPAAPKPPRPAPPTQSRPKTSSPVGGTAPLLRLGSSGPAVTKWQRRLNRTRINDIVADGAFGRGTHIATVSFQKSVGLGPVGLGVVGPKTRAAMRRSLR